MTLPSVDAAEPLALTEAAPVRTIPLKSSEFRRGREASWGDLDELVSRIEKRGVATLSVAELQRLPLLYRSVLSSLSVARSIALDRNLLLYLENLALRAFIAVYAPRMGLGEGIASFLRSGLPRAVRGAGWHILTAFAALAIGVVAGLLLVLADESWFTAIVPAGLDGGRGPSSTREELLATEIYAPWPGALQSFAVFANFLFRHNTIVGIITFSLGIAAGVPTLLLLVYQGVVLGAFFALHYNRGIALDFTGWLMIHGVTELGAIILCGAAGLVIADKLLFPGRYGRLESVAMHGRHAAQIAMGAVLMFFVAGILEGGFRQLIQSTELRMAIGGSVGLVWLGYFLFTAREQRR